ncbi:hypothetical protein PIB30_118102 [Stylosanthes scabra]|uniref:Uncharacterized protein n=1 Tax=Stylosanthes scabra TaxID=79078 RepID=A0ABU6R727_9FABA|nr:hypothetical protein [Stylosanthes scabra]
MPIFSAAILEESVFNLSCAISFSSLWISSLYFSRFLSAFNLIISSLDFADSSICSLSFLIEVACRSSSSFAFASCCHLACVIFALYDENITRNKTHSTLIKSQEWLHCGISQGFMCTKLFDHVSLEYNYIHIELSLIRINLTKTR